MTLLDEKSVTRLNPEGVAVLLVYGAKLFPPGQGRPGIRVTVDAQGTCLLEAVGYATEAAGEQAIEEAGQTCLDAGLVVTSAPRWVETRYPALVVRRRL